MIYCIGRTKELREELASSTATLNAVSAISVVFNCEGHIVRYNLTCEQTNGMQESRQD